MYAVKKILDVGQLTVPDDVQKIRTLDRLVGRFEFESCQCLLVCVGSRTEYYRLVECITYDSDA